MGGRVRGALRAARPLGFAVAVGLALLMVELAAPQFSPLSPLVRYGLRVSVLLAIGVGLLAYWWCRHKGQVWDADLIAALWSGVGGLTMIVALRGTPYGPLGIQGDQSFRTEYITRLADTWLIQDYFYQNRPGYYAPTFFWVLGRTADLLNIEPWRMIKVAAVLGAFLAPLIVYLFWRRHLSLRIAALMAGIPLIVQDWYEPYGWIVLVAFVPWWIEVFYGAQRDGIKQRHLVTLGVIGGVMFSIYYYYFFIIPFFLVVHLIYSRIRGEAGWSGLKRPLIALSVAAATSAFFWAPLAWNFLTARDFTSLNNRWLRLDHGDIPLPMFEPSLTGVLCLAGLVYLVLTARTRLLSRGLLFVVIATYLWHAAGFFLAVVDQPVMSWRMKILVPLTLLSAAVVALAELWRWAAAEFEPRQVRSLSLVLISFLTVFAADRYVTDVSNHEWIKAAHLARLPDGSLPRNHAYFGSETPVDPQEPSAEALKAVLDRHFPPGGRHPVIMTDRIDLYAFYPYYGFVQWNSSYSHPTAEFFDRIALLTELQTATAEDFARRTADNPYDRIDAVVLRVEGDRLAYTYSRNRFPNGTGTYHLFFPKSVIDPAYFDITMVGSVMVAVRR